MGFFFLFLFFGFLPSQLEQLNTLTAQEYDSPKECPVAQSVGAVEYTDCISAEE